MADEQRRSGPGGRGGRGKERGGDKAAGQRRPLFAQFGAEQRTQRNAPSYRAVWVQFHGVAAEQPSSPHRGCGLKGDDQRGGGRGLPEHIEHEPIGERALAGAGGGHQREIFTAYQPAGGVVEKL